MFNSKNGQLGMEATIFRIIAVKKRAPWQHDTLQLEMVYSRPLIGM